MIEVKVARIIRVPREKVAHYFSDAQRYFEVHSKYYRSFHIVSAEANTVVVDEEWVFNGRRSNLRHRIELSLPWRIDLEIISGKGKGSKESIILEIAQEGTKVTYECSFVFDGLAGRLLGWLARKQITQLIEEMAEEDRAFLEGEFMSKTLVYNSQND